VGGMSWAWRIAMVVAVACVFGEMHVVHATQLSGALPTGSAGSGLVASPPSTLLPTGTTTIDIIVMSNVSGLCTDCRWGPVDAPRDNLPNKMAQMNSTAGAYTHGVST
jgi:hypothetical protein